MIIPTDEQVEAALLATGWGLNDTSRRYMRAALTAAFSLAAPAGTVEWQPIETAPKDGCGEGIFRGTRGPGIMLSDGTDIYFGFWNGTSWDDGDYQDHLEDIRFWQPRPALPNVVGPSRLTLADPPRSEAATRKDAEATAHALFPPRPSAALDGNPEGEMVGWAGVSAELDAHLADLAAKRGMTRDQLAVEFRAILGAPVEARMSGLANLLTNCAQILDTVAQEWGKQGAWSEWDQSVRDDITRHLKALDAQPSAALPGKWHVWLDEAGTVSPEQFDYAAQREEIRRLTEDRDSHQRIAIEAIERAEKAEAAALVSQPQPEGEAVAWRSVETAPNDTPLIVAWKERPYEDLYLHTQVATKSSFDRDWTSNASGEPIRKPTHWRAYMSLADAIELGKTDNEANWDTPSRLEASRIRKEARSTHPAPTLQGAGLIEAHKLDTDKRVFFYEQDFYVLSNFSAFSLRRWGQRFDTSEAAYHWAKFDLELPASREVQNNIYHARSAHDAFKIAEEFRHLRRPDWDQVKVDLMRDILRAKADQHEYVRRKLLATGDRELIEDSWRDDFWGWGPNRDGQNMLGKLWMEVRSELRAALSPQRGGEK